MTREELRDHIQRLIQRDLELQCRPAHTGPPHSVPGIRVFADGGEYIVMVGKFLPSAADPLAPLPNEIQHGRECTAAEVRELERTEDW